MLEKPPSIASARPESTAGSRLRPTSTWVTSSASIPARSSDRVEVGGLVGDPGGRDGLAGEVGRARDPRLGQRDQRGQRPRDEGGDRDHRQPLVAGEQDLGLVGDRQVGPPGGHLADRRRGVGGDLGLDLEPGLVEVAALERGVDPGVVGVDVEVERQGERLGVAVAALLLLAAPGDQRRREHEQGDRRPRSRRESPSARAGSTRRAAARSAPAAPKRTIASAESTTTAANTRAVCSCPWATRIRWPRPSSAPDHSPKTAPITEITAAILAPLSR